MTNRHITVEEAFHIVKRVHEDMGWRPVASTSREQRNAWFEAGVAAVHYGHPLFNPHGGDRDWCIKSAGGGRPQSDDILVRASTREYFDLIGGTGTDDYEWGIGRHGTPLPREQHVYAPDKASLSLLPGPTDPPVVEPGEPAPEPEPPSDDLRRELADLKALLSSVVEGQQRLLSGHGGLVAAVADLSRRQEELFDAQTKRIFGILVEPDGSTQPGIPQLTAQRLGR